FNKGEPFQAGSREPSSLAQKIHCVALCIDGSEVDILTKNMRDQIKQFQKIMNEN
ncbi:hypothetical protein ACJMK2_038088, partial [Sinanodonta woodiana]